MFVIIGIVVVLGAVIGGFLMEHGNLKVLIQPNELVTIGGAALGTILIANPLHILKSLVGTLMGVLGGSNTARNNISTPSKCFLNCSAARAKTA